MNGLFCSERVSLDIRVHPWVLTSVSWGTMVTVADNHLLELLGVCDAREQQQASALRPDL